MIVEVSVVPMGKGIETSVSHYVAEVIKFLKEKGAKFELTPMGTILEGSADEVFQLLREIHELPFKIGAQRVITTIKIDDRRDKEVKMEDKIKSVMKKIG